MRKLGMWLLTVLFWPAVGLLIYGAAKIHWGLAVAVGVVAWYFVVEKPSKKVQDELGNALYREWQVSCSLLWALGWANTLGSKGDRERARAICLHTSLPSLTTRATAGGFGPRDARLVHSEGRSRLRKTGDG